MQRVKRETRHRPFNNYERAGQQAHNKPGKNETCKEQELTETGLELPSSGPASGRLLRLQLLNKIFRTAAASDQVSLWALVQPIRELRQIRTSAPGHLPQLKTPLTSLFFLLLRPWVVLIKTDVNFPGCCRPSGGPTSQHWSRNKDRVGRSEPPPLGSCHN